MNCPLCNKPLVTQSPEDAGWGTPDIYCQEILTLPGGKQVNHYREKGEMEETIIIIPPYRIITKPAWNKTKRQMERISKVGLHSRFKTGKKSYYFKTIMTLPELHNDTEERLRNRIKTLLLFS